MINMKIVNYCVDECIRQESGMRSIGWMIGAWNYAQNEMANNRTWPFDADFNPTGQAINKPGNITLEFIAFLGALVDPHRNTFGFRKVPVFVGHEEKIEWERIPERLTALIEAYYDGRLIPDNHPFNGDISKNEVRVCADCGKDYSDHTNIAKSQEDVFYFEYEQIHPFSDGNGRTGKILYNYLLDSMDDPVLPPNFFGTKAP